MPVSTTAGKKDAKAVGMLQSTFQDGLPTSPVDFATLESMARQLGVDKVLTAPLSVSGMLVPFGDGYQVVLNETDPYSRQLYSLAHEIGHLVINRYSQKSGNSKVNQDGTNHRFGHGDKQEERLCEAIAAELLMPREAFFQHLLESGKGLRSVPKLAEIFHSSITATSIRVLEVLDEPGLLVRWRPRRGNSEILELDWQLRNPEPGPSARININRGRGDKIFGPDEAFRRQGVITTNETISTTVKTGIGSTRGYIRFPRYRMESIGFGSNQRRFVLSLAFLSQMTPQPNYSVQCDTGWAPTSYPDSPINRLGSHNFNGDKPQLKSRATHP